jgi:hypothetical protein
VSKYDPIARYLQSVPKSKVALPFSVIEQMVGQLPESAYRDSGWWNSRQSSQSTWLQVGWQVVSVDLKRKVVTFRRVVSRRRSHAMQLPAAVANSASSGAVFEELARRVTSSHFGVELRSGSVSVGGLVPKSFDLVSADHRMVGDAKCYTITAGGNVPSAKWSVIAEYVWLLQQVEADRRFLVFGCDRAVPEGCLDRFQPLTEGVDFYVILDQRLYDLKARARGQ